MKCILIFALLLSLVPPPATAKNGGLLQAESALVASLEDGPGGLDEQKAKSAVLNDIGGSLNSRGKPPEAEQVPDGSLTTRRQILGEEHPAVAESLHNLACALEAEHKLVEAERAHKQALAMRKRIFGDLSFEVAESTCGLARVLVAQGKLTEARELLTPAVPSLHQLATSENLRIGDVLHECGFLLSKLGEFSKAEVLLVDAVAARKRFLGDQHLGVAASLEGLANALKQQGKLERAEAASREKLAVQKHCWSDKHQSIAETLNDLGTIMEDQHQLDQAAALYRESIEMFRALSPDKPPDFERPLINLGRLNRNRGDYATAELLFRQGLESRKNVLSDEDLPTANYSEELATVLSLQHEPEEVERLRRQTLAIRTRVLGEEHTNTILALNNLSFQLLQERKDSDFFTARTELTLARLGLTPGRRRHLGLDESIEVITRAITSGKLVPDEPEETILGCLSARAFLLGQHGDWPTAIEDLTKARRLVPTFLPAFGLGSMLMLIETGDLEGYTNLCRSIWMHFASTKDPKTAAEAAVGMLLRPRAISLSTASDLADLAVERGTNDSGIAFFQLAKALADYRLNRFSTAADCARKSQLGDSGPEIQVAAGAVLALSQWQLKQPDQALQTLSEANSLSQTKLRTLESGDLGANWPEWLIARILLREAGSLIERKSDPQPRD